MKMTIYTYQTVEAVEILKKNGVLRLKEEDRKLTYAGDADKALNNPFDSPYRFIIYKMKELLPPPVDKDCFYPIWAWVKCSGRYTPSKKWDEIHQGKIRLKLEIDSSRLLLSDFDLFCYLISGGLYFKKSQADIDYYGKDIFQPDEFFYPNWEYIFDLHRKEKDDYGCSYHNETIQATFWELFLEDVVEMVQV